MFENLGNISYAQAAVIVIFYIIISFLSHRSGYIRGSTFGADLILLALIKERYLALNKQHELVKHPDATGDLPSGDHPQAPKND